MFVHPFPIFMDIFSFFSLAHLAEAFKCWEKELRNMKGEQYER
jgi:hypothetical protein